MKTKTSLTFLFVVVPFVVVFLSACAQGTTELKPPDIRLGEDVCADCNMIISDARFAASYAYEVGPGRYQNALFDDIGDMLIYADKHPEHKVVAWYVHDYDTKEWVDATQATYVFSNDLETPMATGAAAFASAEAAQRLAGELSGQVLDWNGLRAKHQAGELSVAAAPMGHKPPAAASEPGAETAPLEAKVQAPDGSQITLSVIQPSALARVGKQPIEIVASQALGEAEAAPSDDLALTIEPEMPSMGHGSPGNVNPASQGNGRYLGTVNFTMPGPWTVTVTASRGGAALGQPVFEFSVVR